MTPQDKVSKALIKLLLHNPFFATLLLRLRMVEDKTCETGYTNGVRIGYNPSWIESIGTNG